MARIGFVFTAIGISGVELSLQGKHVGLLAGRAAI